MKKFFGSAAFLALFGLYSLYHYPDSLAAVNPTSGATSNTVVTANSTGNLANAQSSPPPTYFTNDDDNNPLDENGESSSQQVTQAPQSAPAQTTPRPTPKSTGQYKDGTYTGSSIYVYYGNVQVRAIVSGGKLADVQFIQYPNDRRESLQINRQAMPYLTQEAIQAQSANVSGVSGASDTSEGFRQSLAAALSQAKS